MTSAKRSISIDRDLLFSMSTTSPPVSGLSHSDVLNGYAGLAHVYDEVMDEDGSLRPHWRTFARGLDEIGLREFTHRWREAQQLIRENGVTYNVYGDPRGMDRPCQLDPIPLVISPAESDH